jgi:hypothetical protein
MGGREGSLGGEEGHMSSLGFTSKAWRPKDIQESASIDELLAVLHSFPTPDPRDVAGLWHLTSVEERAGKMFVLDGDQVAFVADTPAEAHAFLVGRASATSFAAHMYSNYKPEPS